MVSKYTLQEKRDFAARMRRNPTPAEGKFWDCLRKHSGHGFRRQVIASGWILDFYHARSGVAVELDGYSHNAVDDRRRDEVLGELGIITVRVPNYRVHAQCPMVVREIREFIVKIGSRREELMLINGEIQRDNEWGRL